MAESTARVINAYIKVNGSDLADSIMGDLESIVVESALGIPDTCTIRIDDDPKKSLALIDGSNFSIGDELVIELSSLDDPLSKTAVFDGEITMIAPEFSKNFTATLVITGYDKRHRLMRGTQTRAFVNMSDSDIAQQIISDAGLSAQVDSTATVHDHVLQDNQTNFDFLQMLARRNGYRLYVDGSTLHFKKFSATGSPVTLKWGEDMVSFRARLSAARQVDQVTVRGWDPDAQRSIVGQATTSSTHPAIGYGKTGAKAAASFGTATHIEINQPVKDQSQADKLAQAILDKINAEFAEAEGVAEGNPAIVAGCQVEVENVGTKFGGKYHVTSARHIYAGGLYTTEFEVEGTSPYLLGGILDSTASSGNTAFQKWHGVYPAVVTNNNDDQKLHRVKLKYPWFDDQVESDWARVIAPGAGAERGSVWLPEVGDEVAVIFEHGNFNRPYVIGGIYSNVNKPAAATGSQEPVDQRSWHSRSGHYFLMDDHSGNEKMELQTQSGHILMMDDANKKVQVDTAGGHTITMDDQGRKIEIKTSGGQKVTVDGTGNKIAIEGALNIELKATASVKVQAPQIELSGSAQVKVSGAMVQIG